MENRPESNPFFVRNALFDYVKRRGADHAIEAVSALRAELEATYPGSEDYVSAISAVVTSGLIFDITAYGREPNVEETQGLASRLAVRASIDAEIAEWAIEAWSFAIHELTPIGKTSSAQGPVGGPMPGVGEPDTGQGPPTSALERLKRLREQRRAGVDDDHSGAVVAGDQQSLGYGAPRENSALTASGTVRLAASPLPETIRLEGTGDRVELPGPVGPSPTHGQSATVLPQPSTSPPVIASVVAAGSVPAPPASTSSPFEILKKYPFVAGASALTAAAVIAAIVLTPGGDVARPSGSSAQVSNPIAPTAVPPPTPAVSPTPATIEARWQIAQAQLGAAWGLDWPGAIKVLDDFRATSPDHDESKQKLYGALVEYGKVLKDGGDIQKAVSQWERANSLLPGRGEAGQFLWVLTPSPSPAPPTSTPLTEPTGTPRPGPTPAPASRGSWTVLGGRGTGPGQFLGPTSIGVDGRGSLFVADPGNRRVQRLSYSGSYQSEVSRSSGSGDVTAPAGLAVDSSGSVYIADSGSNSIMKYSGTGRPMGGLGSKGSSAGQFVSPTGIAIDASGYIYVADLGNHRVQKFASDGKPVAQWGSLGSGPGQFNRPCGVAVDSDGNVYVADQYNNRVQKLSSTGRPLAQWGSGGRGPGEFDKIGDVAVGPDGSIYIADYGNNRIQKLSRSGAFVAEWGSKGTGPGEFDRPSGITVDGNGSVYVADTGNNRVQKLINP